MDLFPTSLNSKLPLFVSPIPDPQAWAVDALNIPWENLVAYSFPPTALLPSAQGCAKTSIAHVQGLLQTWQLLRLSTTAIYSSKCSVFQRWCVEQVDFRNPSIGNFCNFFWYLFHDLNRCPSTTEGYRRAIADTLRNSDLHISSNTDITRLVASFYKDKPNVSRSLPTWNLPLVLQKLTQPPFQPKEECTRKLITWKKVFLLTLASGKSSSKIHVWT